MIADGGEVGGEAAVVDLSLLSVLGRCLPNITALADIPPSFTGSGLPASVNDTVGILKNGTG